MSPVPTFKFVIVGPTSVGKSCLLLQYTDGTYDGSVDATVGVEFGIRTFRLGERTVKLQIWDTAGQESFRSITHSYYRGSHGALIVYDISRRESFIHMKGWLDDVRHDAAEGVVVALVGNKCDLESRRCVSTEEAQQFAQENGILFFEASAKTGKNVEEVFVETAKCIADRVESGELSLKDGDLYGTKNRMTATSEQSKEGGCCS